MAARWRRSASDVTQLGRQGRRLPMVTSRVHECGSGETIVEAHYPMVGFSLNFWYHQRWISEDSC